MSIKGSILALDLWLSFNLVIETCQFWLMNCTFRRNTQVSIFVFQFYFKQSYKFQDLLEVFMNTANIVLRPLILRSHEM